MINYCFGIFNSILSFTTNLVSMIDVNVCIYLIYGFCTCFFEVSLLKTYIFFTGEHIFCLLQTFISLSWMLLTFKVGVTKNGCFFFSRNERKSCYPRIWKKLRKIKKLRINEIFSTY